MFFYIGIIFTLSIIAILLINFHRLCLLEAVDKRGAELLMKGADIGILEIITAVFQENVRIHPHQKLDPHTSITQKEYQLADTPHPPTPLEEDWAAVADAALSSTKEVITHFKYHQNSPGDEMQLCLFIQSIVLGTFLHLFFRLPVTPTSIDDVVWIANDTLQMDDRRRDPASSPELSRLIKPSPNPFGVFPVLFATQRLILAAICTRELEGGKISFLRRAGTLLRNPTSTEREVGGFVEKIKQSNPPIQFVRGCLSFGGTQNNIDFFVPIDLLPLSSCITGLNGSCASWLHKAALLPGQSECGGDGWLVHLTAIVLSAIETEIRQAHLAVDGDKHGSEAWEEWTIRRLRVG